MGNIIRFVSSSIISSVVFNLGADFWDFILVLICILAFGISHSLD